MKKSRSLFTKSLKYMVPFVSIGILSLSYFYIFNELQSKTEELYLEAEHVKHQMIEQENRLGEEDELLLLLPELSEKKQDIISQYPVQLVEEDHYLFLDGLEKQLKLKISDVKITKDMLLYTTKLPAVRVKEIEQRDQYMTAWVSSVDLNLQMDYKGLKGLVKYINQYPDKTVINSFNVSYDPSLETLVGSLNIHRYVLTGTGEEYEEAFVRGVNFGTDNIFGMSED